MQGASAEDVGNFIGPDGQPYLVIFRSPDALEAEAASREMTGHGYTDRSIVLAVATRGQFTEPPLNWRRKTGTRLYPQPATECLIASVSTDSPLSYAFVLLFKQQPSPGS